MANTEVPAETFPVRFLTELVATMPVPASPSGGQNGMPGFRLPEGSSSFAPSSVSLPASSPATKISGRMFSNRLAQSFFGIPPNVDTRVLRVERTVRRKGMPWPEIVDTMVMALAPSLLVWTALFAIWSFHITVVDAYTAVLTLSVLITMLVMPWLVLRSLNVRVGTEGGGMSVYKGLLGTSAHAAAALALLCVVVAFYLYTGVDTLGYILASAAMTAAVVTLSSWFYFLEYECGVVEFLTTDGSASIYMEGGQAASRNRLDDGIPGTPGRDGSSASSDQKY